VFGKKIQMSGGGKGDAWPCWERREGKPGVADLPVSTSDLAHYPRSGRLLSLRVVLLTWGEGIDR
jgi:hypothetical protein